ncbi:MAG: hypothetical protein VX246_14470, partial [Myxococcota bacterium]|nr:hypothetical protein [Myxococcota bacterium]
VVGDQQIADALRLLPPREAVPHLVSVANENGGPDNVTVMVSALVLDEEGHAEVPHSGHNGQRMRTITASVTVALLLLVVIALLLM